MNATYVAGDQGNVDVHAALEYIGELMLCGVHFNQRLCAINFFRLISLMDVSISIMYTVYYLLCRLILKFKHLPHLSPHTSG